MGEDLKGLIGIPVIYLIGVVSIDSHKLHLPFAFDVNSGRVTMLLPGL